MSAPDITTPAKLTRAERIHLLRLACAGDRLELALLALPPAPSLASRLLQRFGLPPWLNVAASVLAPYVPRKLRLVLSAARIWRQTWSRQIP